MFYRLLSSAVKGIEGYLVNVEVDIAGGFPRFDIVGLPDSSVRESTDRVRTSLRNSGYELPVERITINLAPAHMKKVGAGFDLSIAVGILACKNIIPQCSCEDVLFLGELSLNGEVKPITGILSMIISAKERGITKCFVPFNNEKEASAVRGMNVIGVKDLVEVIQYLKSKNDPWKRCQSQTYMEFVNSEYKNTELDMSQVKGQMTVKRALEIAVTGMHNILLIGPPGSGKTMMVKRLSSIMPRVSYAESVEMTKVHSVAGQLNEEEGLLKERPFRAPHHTASYASLIGGGAVPKPGEISLAHHGILFLDELPEFRKDVIEALRQPLEEGVVTISRASGTTTYPSKFMLVASMNPCPCGYYPDMTKCRCSPEQIRKYIHRISGPILDRIDIHIEANAIDYTDLTSNKLEETSREISKRVNENIVIQKNRNGGHGTGQNAYIRSNEMDNVCRLDEKAKKMLEMAFSKMGLSARAYHRILRVSRTIADMEQSELIGERHVAEAIQYRTLDRKYWHNGY